MELTTSYQKLGEAYVGSSGGDLYIRIYAKYSEQDISNNRTKVQYQARAYFSGNYIYDQQSSGNVKGTSANQVNFTKSTNYNNGETILGTAEAWVTHDADGTKTITASAYLRFPNWSWSNTANGSATLPNLHKPPEFETAEMEETNATMLALNIPDTTIVRHLSQKQITLHGFTYDDATLTYRLEHFGTTYNIPTTGYQASNVFNTDYRTNDITIDSNNKASIVQKLADSLNGTATDWLYVNIGGTPQKPNAIPYAKPSLVGTTTTIKRKSGNGTNLTDNKANLNLVGTIYKANDIIGNDNAITQTGYKIWEDDTSEPANYTTLTPIISGGDVTITNYEISNIDFTKIYNYKIKLADKYYEYEIEGTVPLGQATWSEYKDRVDFLKLTVSGYNPFEYSEDETICGVWNDGYDTKPIYRKVVDFGYLPDSSAIKSVNHDISNLEQVTKAEIIGKDNLNRFFPIPFSPVSYMLGGDSCSARITSTTIDIYTSGDWTNFTAYVVLEYTKTTDA